MISEGAYDMDNITIKKRAGSIKIQMMEEEFNSLFSVLSAFVEADAESSYGQFATYLMQKIMEHGREYVRNDRNRIEIGLYQREAQNLINLFVVYESLYQKPKENFYEKFHQNRC